MNLDLEEIGRDVEAQQQDQISGLAAKLINKNDDILVQAQSRILRKLQNLALNRR